MISEASFYYVKRLLCAQVLRGTRVICSGSSCNACYVLRSFRKTRAGGLSLLRNCFLFARWLRRSRIIDGSVLQNCVPFVQVLRRMLVRAVYTVVERVSLPICFVELHVVTLLTLRKCASFAFLILQRCMSIGPNF